MIHIIIDTTVLRNDPARKKAAFRSLKSLAKNGHLKIHLPYIVKQEFISQQIEDYHSSISHLVTDIAKFSKKNLPDSARGFLNATEKDLKTLDNELFDFVKSDFEKWLFELSAEEHHIADSHGQKVMDSYFKGVPPFREKKKKDDIPDAFIWQIVLDIVQTHETVFVITNDKGIQAACENNDKITCFESLDVFISSDFCQHIFKEETAKHNFQDFISLKSEIMENMQNSLSAQMVDTLHGKTVTSEQIPDDNNEATIFLVGDADDIEIRTIEAEYYGNGLFVIPVEFYTECLLWYAVFKADFYILSDEKIKGISISNLNDHYFDAEEYYNLRVQASISLDFQSKAFESDNITKDDFDSLLEKIEIHLDSIDEIEIPDDFDA